MPIGLPSSATGKPHSGPRGSAAQATSIVRSVRARSSIVDSVGYMTVSISITLDDELGEELNAVVPGGNRSALVAEAIREYLVRRAVSAAADWHTSLTGADAAVFEEFNAAC